LTRSVINLEEENIGKRGEAAGSCRLITISRKRKREREREREKSISLPRFSSILSDRLSVVCWLSIFVTALNVAIFRDDDLAIMDHCLDIFQSGFQSANVLRIFFVYPK